MEKNYISPIILNELKKEYAYYKILSNPRISEIEELTFSTAENMGLLPENRNCLQYRIRIIPRIEMLLSSHFLKVDRMGNIIVTLPFKWPQDEQEIITYMIDQEDVMKRIKEKTVKGKIEEKIVSYINEEGIEIKQEISNRKGMIHLERMEQYPHIVRANVRNREEYFDISNLEHPEDISVKGAVKKNKDEISEISNVDKIRIVEKTKNTPYEDGIKNMYGMKKEINKVQKEK